MKKLALPFFLMLLWSCNNAAEESSTTADTLSVAIRRDSVNISELAEYPGLPEDSIYIRRGNTVQAIHGIREDDDLIVEGDIKFTLEDQYLNDREMFGRRVFSKRRREKYIYGVGTSSRLWPVVDGHIQLAYRIHSSMKDSSRIFDGLQKWERTGIVRFVRSAGDEKGVVEFISSRSTQSNIGKTGLLQTIELEAKMRGGNVAHEIGHALGLFHEHCRSDRNKFLSISCSNHINYRFAFQKDSTAVDLNDYDPYSIMHYPPDKCMKCLVKDLPKTIPGQRDSVSAGDVLSLKALYKLKN